MNEKTAETDAQAALRRAERLLAVYARQCDSLLRARQARPAADGKEGKEGLVIEGVAFEPPPWMEMLTEEARAWLQGQLTEAVQSGKRTPGPKRLEAKALPAAG
jgi:hypothetical protein